jgi:pilus assembly protein CpaB
MVHTSDESNKPISKIVLERILVLAIAQDVATADKPRVVNAVTLEVTPEQAERIDLAREVGTLSLVLRNQGDKEPSVTAGARKNDLIRSAALIAPPPVAANGDGASKPKPAPVVRRPVVAKAAPAAVQPRHTFEVIRGSKKSVEEIPAETNPT